MSIPRIRATELDQLAGIAHGFFTRDGGVSAGLYESLNCGLGSDDAQDLVAENRSRVARAVGVEPVKLATPYQIHSPDAVVVNDVWSSADRPRADAVVTDRPGIALGVGTADCGPVLFADAAAGVVGAAHAGWRGALTGVLDAAVTAMEGLGGDRDRIVAVLGPTISAANYEVDDAFRVRFETADADNARFFGEGRRADHHQFDLPAYIMARLTGLGLAAVRDLARCTYADAARFYSYRRMTHLGESDYGRQLSVIAIVADRGG